VDNSLQYFLRFGFYDDNLVNDNLLNDFRRARNNPEQKWLTLSFVSGQIYRSFEQSSQNVFVPTLVLFGAKYEAFGDTHIACDENSKSELVVPIVVAGKVVAVLDLDSPVMNRFDTQTEELILKLNSEVLINLSWKSS
jgi:hypothetical protein